MRTKTIHIYTYDELSDKAKEKARDWYRGPGLDYDWWDAVYDDAKTIAFLMGIEIEHIYFSGFSSQGDGAQFEGTYRYRKGSVKAIKAHAPEDTVLHGIAERLQEVQRGWFWRLGATVKASGHYSHEYATVIAVTEVESGYEMGGSAEADVTDALRDFMRWIYRYLETEYNYLNSDESVEEAIRTNGYEFDEYGNHEI
jgi:hypothetical protein